MRDAFIARRDYILNDVFGERLPFLDDNPPILENLSSLEKLTSRTTRRFPARNGSIGASASGGGWPPAVAYPA